MSVRSRIAIKQKDNTYKSIGCHSDGNLDGNGKLLYRYYRDPVKINILMNLGNLSALGKNIFPNPLLEHNFDNRQDDVCVAYCRDRGSKMYFEIDKTLEDLLKSVALSDQDYLYLYEDGIWKFANTQTINYSEIKLFDLDDLIKYNKIEQPLSSNSFKVDLAKEIANYSKETDPKLFDSLYSSFDNALYETERSLMSKSDVDTIMEWIGADIDYYSKEEDLSNHDTYKNFKTACSLLYKLNQYKLALDKTLDKEMDM